MAVVVRRRNRTGRRAFPEKGFFRFFAAVASLYWWMLIFFWIILAEKSVGNRKVTLQNNFGAEALFLSTSGLLCYAQRVGHRGHSLARRGEGNAPWRRSRS